MELTVTNANVNLETNTVVVTGYDIDEVISEIGVEEILKALDYSDVVDFVGRMEKEKKEDDPYNEAGR